MTHRGVLAMAVLDELRRINRRTLDEERIALTCVAVCCVDCGRFLALADAWRDTLTGEWFCLDTRSCVETVRRRDTPPRVRPATSPSPPRSTAPPTDQAERQRRWRERQLAQDADGYHRREAERQALIRQRRRGV